jgi:hypothetical protein
MNDILSFKCEKDNIRGEGRKQSCSNPYSPSLQIENIHYDNIHSVIDIKQVGGEGNTQ